MANLITDIGRGADEMPNNYVRIQYKIEKMKAKNQGPPPVCKNADISEENFHGWGFSVIVRGHQKGDMNNKAYKPFIAKLPYEIVPSASYFTVEDDFLFAWLKKKEERSWEAEISMDMLETADS